MRTALALYPPSARQRPARSGVSRGSKGGDIKGPGVPDGDKKGEDGGSARVGRYQLIREFLRRKTGKVRSLQQIGSRMQHLRRAHAGDAYSACPPLPLLRFRRWPLPRRRPTADRRPGSAD